MRGHRRRMIPRKDKRKFTQTAKRVHKRNVSGRPMRGGIRL